MAGGGGMFSVVCWIDLDSAQGGSLMTHRLAVLTAVSLFTLSLGVGAVFAAGEPDPRPTNPPPPSSTGQPKGKTGATKKKQQKSEREFLDQYRAAYALKLAGDYPAAFAAFKALEADGRPDG